MSKTTLDDINRAYNAELRRLKRDSDEAIKLADRRRAASLLAYLENELGPKLFG